MRNLKFKNLKKGYIYTKNGVTVFYAGGKITVTKLYYSANFGTIEEAKKEIKTLIKT